MPNIDPNLIPSVNPGSLFNSLTTDASLSVRWLQPNEPVYYSVFNRPLADSELRLLIAAKSIDSLSIGAGRQTLFPFVIPTTIISGSSMVDLPQSWIWDINISAPDTWENFRLARVKRMSGVNSGEASTGIIRLIFSANKTGSPTEINVFYADYVIDSNLSYQRQSLGIVTASIDTNNVSIGDAAAMHGFITMRTISLTNNAFLTLLAALDPTGFNTDANSDGYYDNPNTLEVSDSINASSSLPNDLSSTSITHGTGLLLDSVYNPIPPISSNVDTWITSFNYPFDANASRTSFGTYTIEIPANLFNEFAMLAPGPTLPTDPEADNYYPVWLSKAEKSSGANPSDPINIKLIFSTRTTSIGSSNTDAIEFAEMIVPVDGSAGDVIEIRQLDNLRGITTSDKDLYLQQFGRGYAILSGDWAGPTSMISTWFTEMENIAVDYVEYSQADGRISSFALHLASSYSPTAGQAEALLGTTSDRITPMSPGDGNKFVTAGDEGAGDAIDLEAQPSITSHPSIERTGYAGGRAHKAVKLYINKAEIDLESGTFYDDHILPRLRVLLGRDPVDFDMWYTGTGIMTYVDGFWID